MPKISDYTDCEYDNFSQFGRALYKYTDCGPWVVAVLTTGKEIYYDDEEARKLPMHTQVKCLRVGSIVEGSDAEVGPYDVMKPKDFDSTIERINQECTDLWHEANEDEDTDE